MDHRIEYQESSTYLTADQRHEQYAKIYRTSHIPCITAKIDTTIETEPPVLDADGFAICPDCGSRVNCGIIGLPNLEKRHRGTKVCKTAKQKRDKDAKKKKDGTKLNFLRPKAAVVPSTVHGPPPVHSYKLVPQPARNASPAAASTTSEQGKAVSNSTSKSVSVPISNSFIEIWSKTYRRVSLKHPNLIGWPCLEETQRNLMTRPWRLTNCGKQA